MRKLWGGAFSSDSDALVDEFGGSLESDLAFWKEDVEGSIAHARMLGVTGIVSESESADLVRGLNRILSEGPEKLPRDVEDIHTAVEARLGEIVGDVAGKLHTARSRNDQVATDARLYLRRRLGSLATQVKGLQSTILTIAESNRATIMPGYTHQQPAQPITLAFHMLAHFWALQRHGMRIENLLELFNLCPLGSAALAGTSFPIDRQLTAKELGFEEPTSNALDATSDRSYVIDALNLCANLMIDLSRISQEIILWSTSEFGFLKLADDVRTGSSIMPQKRNPDMAELVRGRTGRVIGNWTAFASTMKALPLGYNRDTQDDKPGLFESLDLTESSVRLVSLMLKGATWKVDRMSRQAEAGFSTATDLADHLAKRGIPFRKAHEIVGQVVRGCIERGWHLQNLTSEQLKQLAPEVDENAVSCLSVKSSVESRESFGGTGPKSVAVQIERAKQLLESENFGVIA